jgi:hypothetical protein
MFKLWGIAVSWRYKIKTQMKVVNLSAFKKEIRLELGDRCDFTYNEHVSVGYTADFEIENEEVLSHLETNTTYQYPKKINAGMTGADAAETTFSFIAKAKGTTLLFVRKYFRFDLEEEFQFRIIVE